MLPLRQRLKGPIRSLRRHFAAKAVVATLLIQLDLDFGLAHAMELLDVDLNAAFVLGFTLAADFASGLYASWWRKTDELGRVAWPLEFIESAKMRDSVIKVGEYVTLLFLITLGSNAWEMQLGWARRWAFIFVWLTELWSIAENFKHASARGLIRAFKRQIRSRTDITTPSNPNAPE